MEAKDKCLQFLIAKLEPQKKHVQMLGYQNSMDLTYDEQIEQSANYRLQCDILNEHEQQYSKLLNEVKLELRNNQ